MSYSQVQHRDYLAPFDYDKAPPSSMQKDCLDLLEEIHEKSLMTTLSRYPEVIELAAGNRAPQHLVHYLRDLANEFHTYYNAHQFIVDDDALRGRALGLAARLN